MDFDALLIFILVIAWFFVDRNDRQREKEERRVEWERGKFGNVG